MAEVLIIEDEVGIAESLAYLLRQEGFGVRHATRMAAGREAAPRADLIVLDLTLPDGSGLELMRQLRAGALPGAGAKTPVIILTSRDTEVDRVVGLELGADDYVVKPFSPRELVARVKAVLRRTTPEPEAVAANGGYPIAVDADKRQVTIGGKPLGLSRTEFDLLACLVETPGKVFTRERLLDRVWGDDSAVTDRTVDAHLKAVRRKIALLGEDPDLIETVRGVGYRAREI